MTQVRPTYKHTSDRDISNLDVPNSTLTWGLLLLVVPFLLCEAPAGPLLSVIPFRLQTGAKKLMENPVETSGVTAMTTWPKGEILEGLNPGVSMTFIIPGFPITIHLEIYQT